MAQRDHYLEIDYCGWGYAGELYPDALSQAAAARVHAAAESRPAIVRPSLQQKIAALLSQNVAELDPKYKIWMATFSAITAILAMALVAVFIVTH